MVMRWLVFFVVVSSTARALTAVVAPKETLRSLFVGVRDPVLADPVTKSPFLERTLRMVGGDPETTFVSPTAVYGTKQNAYLDLVDPKQQPPSFEDLGVSLRRFLARSPSVRVQTDTFRSPLTAFLYERGWRQNFERNGFPGPDKEFAEAKEFFGDVGVLVDLSCGTGLMTRRFLKQLPETRIIAADYSEAMLLETRRRIDSRLPDLVRVDAAQLPFQTSSVDAIHAGAAMHCWPRLEDALAEIHRALTPEGGKFFATTFLTGALGTSL
ncbi:hypothetical protein CTAYLR_007296 [Chrysophaeum taylorii]|uniref:Methyltransferase domain-containing protein n=1 Tax=Chrysophaeum taylorii TaxID=2483200 RepID=A0AAD7XP65_9STRA|nr:hypothetical protein CTAYLR_007296 [Chrysophaeum taylorii]